MCLSWEGQDTMEETAMGADTWVGPEYRKKENGSLQPQEEDKGRTQLPSPGWRVGFGRLFYSPMSMLSDSRPKAAHRCFSPVIR